FVALKDSGGLKWLCYEFGVPLALILVMAVIIPILHRHDYISIYEYLEDRFDSGTRTLVSLLFQLGRGLATAVSVLAGGLILSTALAIPTSTAIVLIGAITIVYDVLGGIRVVILSDVLQMMIIAAGILICGGVAWYLVGWEGGWTSLSPDRLRILDFKHWGLSSEGEYAFWPMTIGGMFLYASYYGCDQSQVQRELTVGSVDNVRKSLMVNALGRFPLVLLYCAMGVFVGAVLAQPESVARVASILQQDTTAVTQSLQNDPDRMVPLFILSFLPHGLIGFIFVAIMAALMSSLDSGLNSLSAVTMRDFYQKYVGKDRDDRHYLFASKMMTLFWGIFCVAAALVFANVGESTRQTTIVLINAVGSLLYGPILAAFLLGMLAKVVTPGAVKVGVLAGILVNLVLWMFTPISWLWWNVTGFAAAITVALLMSLGQRTKLQLIISSLIFSPDQEEKTSINWPLIYKLVSLYFLLIVLICYLIEKSI
ncbi:MAG: sodium/solute symporter, partial [bacterium]